MLLSSIAGTGDLFSVIQASLKQTQSIVTTDHRTGPPWALLPVFVCDAIGGRGERAIPASAAIFLLKAAAEFFDDVEDEDTPGSISVKYGTAVATNVATALLFMAELALMRLKTAGVPDTDVVKVIEQVNSYHLNACAGQHTDIVSSGKTSITENDYFTMIKGKTASQLECSCLVGAMLGNAGRDLINSFLKLGRGLGMAAQIANDIRGVEDGKDIIKRKVSLPVIFALTQANDVDRKQLEDIFGGRANIKAFPEQIRDMLFRMGAIQYAMVQMEVYRQAAHDALSEIKAGGACVERLKVFLR